MEEPVDVERTKFTFNDRKRSDFNKILACKYDQAVCSQPEMIHVPFYLRTGVVVNEYTRSCVDNTPITTKLHVVT
jgi:hypothetical protein